MTLLQRWRALSRAWSMQLAAIGALLSAALLAIDPAALQAAWQAMPADVRALIPEHVRSWVALALFLAVLVTRPLAQPSVERRLGLMAAGSSPAWLIAARSACLRQITSIAVHCSATREGRPFHVADVRAWHKARGFDDIGYHFLVALDGTIEVGRAVARAGAHVQGFNQRSIGVCYVGGVGVDGKTPKDTRTPAQKVALLQLLGELKARWPEATIKGHRDYPKVAKACPSFDAQSEYASIGKPA